jgi:hypothetical protein
VRYGLPVRTPLIGSQPLFSRERDIRTRSQRRFTEARSHAGPPPLLRGSKMICSSSLCIGSLRPAVGPLGASDLTARTGGSRRRRGSHGCLQTGRFVRKLRPRAHRVPGQKSTEPVPADAPLQLEVAMQRMFPMSIFRSLALMRQVEPDPGKDGRQDLHCRCGAYGRNNVSGRPCTNLTLVSLTGASCRRPQPRVDSLRSWQLHAR